MELLLHLLLLGLFATCAGSPAPLLSETRYGVERPGEECLMGSGHVGQCMEIYQCLDKRATLLSNNTLHRCQTSQDGKIYICCHDYVQLAADLCSTWNEYSSAGRGGPSTDGCVIQHQLIVGGSEASPGEFKHIARVGWFREQTFQIDYDCGGTLVSPFFVLTAAHCVYAERQNYFVILGDHDKREVDYHSLTSLQGSVPRGLYRAEEMIQLGDILVPTEQKYTVKRKIIHPLYQESPKYHDLALLELSEPAVLTSRVIPVCLTSQPYTEPKNGEQLIAAGWGRLAQGVRETPNALNKVYVPKVSSLKCNVIFNQEHYKKDLPLGITNDMFCAGEDGKDTCKGDSGGPLVRVVTRGGIACEHELVGVVAFGVGCGEIGVYTRIHKYLPWILDHIMAQGNVNDLNQRT